MLLLGYQHIYVLVFPVQVSCLGLLDVIIIFVKYNGSLEDEDAPFNKKWEEYKLSRIISFS